MAIILSMRMHLARLEPKQTSCACARSKTSLFFTILGQNFSLQLYFCVVLSTKQKAKIDILKRKKFAMLTFLIGILDYISHSQRQMGVGGVGCTAWVPVYARRAADSGALSCHNILMMNALFIQTARTKMLSYAQVLSGE
jgi:hypothetical protein